jgi:hypothetical protein
MKRVRNWRAGTFRLPRLHTLLHAIRKWGSRLIGPGDQKRMLKRCRGQDGVAQTRPHRQNRGVVEPDAQGHLNYYTVPEIARACGGTSTSAWRWLKSLKRRSQRAFELGEVPPAPPTASCVDRILHPLPCHRFGANPGKARCVNAFYAGIRAGARSNPRPYRDHARSR